MMLPQITKKKFSFYRKLVSTEPQTFSLRIMSLLPTQHSWLPLCHIFQRMWGHWQGKSLGPGPVVFTSCLLLSRDNRATKAVICSRKSKMIAKPEVKAKVLTAGMEVRAPVEGTGSVRSFWHHGPHASTDSLKQGTLTAF